MNALSFMLGFLAGVVTLIVIIGLTITFAQLDNEPVKSLGKQGRKRPRKLRLPELDRKTQQKILDKK